MTVPAAASQTTLVAVTRILNESDIAEAFVRHTAHFVDHHILLDNGSVDGTLEILRKLRQEGLGITLYQSRSRSFVEAQALTFMFRRAVIDRKADWVVFLDTDEFIDDRDLGQPLRDHLAEFATSHADQSCISVPLRDYHITPDDAPHSIVPCRITRCSPATGTRKVIVRRDLLHRQVLIHAGSHSLRADDVKDWPAFPDPVLRYAHYPVRSPYQWLSKSVIGWAKVLAAGSEPLNAGLAAQYREPFDLLRKDPRKLLRNRALMDTLTAPPGLTHDPLDYRGGELKYTGPTDYPMRAVQVMVQYLHELATQHGEMMEPAMRLAEVVQRDEVEFRPLP